MLLFHELSDLIHYCLQTFIVHEHTVCTETHRLSVAIYGCDILEKALSLIIFSYYIYDSDSQNEEPFPPLPLLSLVDKTEDACPGGS